MAACLQTLDKRLILLVEKFRELYDKTHNCYKDVELKEDIWATISQELNVEGR
jgi:hypothetical protein